LTTEVLIVTGGSSGIGAATARLAAQRGYAVCINYLRRQDEAEEVVGSIQREGGRAIAVQADISSEPDVLRLFETVDRELGPLTALVNNAATLERQMRLDSMDAARLQRIFATNIIGPFLCAREAVRRMSTLHGGRGGSIVNVSSGAARSGSPGEYIDYAASKGAVDTLTIGLAKEVAEEGIRVNGVRPGFIYTDLHAKGGEPDRVNRVKTRVPMQRGGQPEEVATAILWLLSNEASYVTGTIVMCPAAHNLTPATAAPRSRAHPSTGNPVPGTGRSAAYDRTRAVAGSSHAGHAREPGP
jgi:NAD(P)-dependent dehydrogenase (short-subunit alcohol dehydrogenase family)